VTGRPRNNFGLKLFQIKNAKLKIENYDERGFQLRSFLFKHFKLFFKCDNRKKSDLLIKASVTFSNIILLKEI